MIDYLLTYLLAVGTLVHFLMILAMQVRSPDPNLSPNRNPKLNPNPSPIPNLNLNLNLNPNPNPDPIPNPNPNPNPYPDQVRRNWTLPGDFPSKQESLLEA